MKKLSHFIPLLLFGFTVGCNGINTVKNKLRGQSPYEAYVADLEKANLKTRPMVRDWIKAGEETLHDSVIINLPYSETGHFVSHRPEARSYRFTAQDGQVLTINGALKITAGARIFADLFIKKDYKWKHVASSDSSLTLTHEFSDNAECLLRIQPELLVNAYYTISVGLTPVLINPVSGADNRSIQSLYGASRDGGKRKHEGIDIFAKKGTPVVAPTKGTVSRVGYSKLGGKVVWMHDTKRGHSYYFAHLDSQYVRAGMFLNQGDTIGTVGNTGNARRTPAHLHFGIYQSKSKDPLFYVKTLEAMENSIAIDTTFEFLPFKTSGEKITLRSGPSQKLPVVRRLQAETLLYVVAQNKDWYRVALPDHRQGFVLKKEVTPAIKGKLSVLSSDKQLIADLMDKNTVVKVLAKDSAVEMLAKFQQYTLIRTQEGLEGWIQ